jgi:hypothetical protein
MDVFGFPMCGVFSPEENKQEKLIVRVKTMIKTNRNQCY